MYQSKIDVINEKIRLLYVGITRAKEMLILSCSSYKDETEIGKKTACKKPSIYINELEKHIQQKEVWKLNIKRGYKFLNNKLKHFIYSQNSINTYKSCPTKFKYKYIDK